MRRILMALLAVSVVACNAGGGGDGGGGQTPAAQDPDPSTGTFRAASTRYQLQAQFGPVQQAESSAYRLQIGQQPPRETSP